MAAAKSKRRLKRQDWRDLPPVKVNVERPEKASQTLLAKVDRCQRAAYLYLKHGGGVDSAPMARGTAFHLFAEDAVLTMQRTGEIQMPGEVAKDRMQGIIEAHPELTLPEDEQEALRVMAWQWAEGTIVELDAIAGVELMVEIEVGAWTVRGKIDLLLIRGNEAWVKDYKTSLAITPQEDFERDFQTKLYAACVGYGRIEGDPLPLGQGVDVIHVSQEYPRYTRQDDGSLVARRASYTRPELADFIGTIETHLAKLEHGLRTGKWPAVPGEKQCSECPAPRECPIPDHLRPVIPVDSIATAEDMAVRWEFILREATDIKKSLKAWHETSGAPIFFGDLVLDTTHGEKSAPIDREKLRYDIEALANFGREFDLEAYFRKVSSSSFGKRQRRADEKPEE